MNNTESDKNQLGDTVSPATRLLEKRRQMYEKQEEYENKKKDSKQAELMFKETEKELRHKDLEIQESMIQFSVFLQDNEKKKNKAGEKIAAEKKETLKLEAEIALKKKQEAQLKAKAQRIDLKKKAIQKYEDFLNDVIEKNQDEFTEVTDIINRYDVLIQEKQKLDMKHHDLETKHKKMKDDTNKYIKEQDIKIMKLNNENGHLKEEWEEVMEQQNQLKNNAADNLSKKNGKISELAQILMAIENIEQKCYKREGTKAAVKHNLPDNKPDNFDKMKTSGDFAKRQLNAIKYYWTDYKEIIKNVEIEDPKVKDYIQKLKDTSELI